MRSTNSTRRRLKSHLVDLCFYLTRGYFGIFVRMVIIGVKRRMVEPLGKHTKYLRLSLLDPFSVIRWNHHGYVCLVTLKFLFRSFRMVSSIEKRLLVLLEKSHYASLPAIGSLAVKLKNLIIEYRLVVVVTELLKDKLQQWLSSKSMGESDQPGCSLSKKERGIIHMIAGLGFEWALNPILSHGVGVNFWYINGWTALHWASRFGRKKMVAARLASGAFAGAVTDPTSQDQTGRAPAFIAASNGHKGLAGYLSKVSLTSHLSSLTLEESELSKGSAEIRLYCGGNRKELVLRGFLQETQSSIDDSEDEGILKVFHKEKVDGAIDEAVSRVLGMVDSLDARQQYRRMLERYRQAKAELGATVAAVSISGGDIVNMDNDDSYLLE
ncbi:hypothetical protein LWI29_000203 [Acer saccharum]|uniref:Uncharacterized protein n=1 Tax=Acer saccharum TaxID=4024 RepID=A0AA39SLH7_ACESA|nr:hypothetical protein LWI29_000203 [Acer saccharum]